MNDLRKMLELQKPKIKTRKRKFLLCFNILLEHLIEKCLTYSKSGIHEKIIRLNIVNAIDEFNDSLRLLCEKFKHHHIYMTDDFELKIQNKFGF